MITDIDFTLIPLSEIRKECREIAVSWADESKGYMWIGDMHKLASDIQNYSDWFAKNKE